MMTTPVMLSLFTGVTLLTSTAATAGDEIYSMIPNDESAYEDWVPDKALLFRNGNLPSVRVRNEFAASIDGNYATLSYEIPNTAEVDVVHFDVEMVGRNLNEDDTCSFEVSLDGGTTWDEADPLIMITSDTADDSSGTYARHYASEDISNTNSQNVNVRVVTYGDKVYESCHLLSVTVTEGMVVEPFTESEIHQLQENWGNAIKSITQSYQEKGDFVGVALAAAGELYGYGSFPVLFKPTKAAIDPFRPAADDALSYFVGGSVLRISTDFDGYAEDGGFAINNGKGWSEVSFENHMIDISENGDIAIAMGTYTFTCATSGEDTSVHYTFGYKRNDEGRALIFVHHSSVPYGY
jgi:hypothetical protein